MITTVTIGTNAELFPKVLELYAKPNDRILDMTYGKGVFWKNIDKEQYRLITNDLIEEGAERHFDFRDTTFRDNFFDSVVFDPPYYRVNNKHGIMANNYNNFMANLRTHKSIIEYYREGFVEAHRILKSGGFLFTKCQDETESNTQKWTHIELMDILKEMGFKSMDMLLLIRKGVPMIGKGHLNQKTARKMHSYMLVHKKL